MLRPFPRARLRAAIACAVVVAASVPALAPLAAADDLRDRQSKVRGDIRSTMTELGEASKEVAAANRRLERSRAQLATAQKRLASAQAAAAKAAEEDAAMQARLAQAEADLAKSRRELEAARARLKEQRRQIGEMAATNYIYGDPALMGLTVMLNSQDPDELTSQMGTVDALMDRQTNTLEDLSADRIQMIATEARVEAATADVAVQRRAAAKNLVAMKGFQQQAEKVSATVASLVARNRAAEAAAQAARQADLAKLKALEAQEARIRQQIIARAARQKGGYSGANDGFLYRPVPGVVTSPYGYRTHPIYGYYGLHDGTDFRTPCGQTMRAAGTGTVVSKYYSDVYGNRLYVDLGRVNGKNMTVVYNHASGYRVGVGERVGRGEVVGYAGSTGWSTGCHLHFTVLLNGDSTDPMNYM